MLTPSRSYPGHKLVLSARSCDWVKGQYLSSHVLDWRDLNDRTKEPKEACQKKSSRLKE